MATIGAATACESILSHLRCLNMTFSLQEYFFGRAKRVCSSSFQAKSTILENKLFLLLCIFVNWRCFDKKKAIWICLLWTFCFTIFWHFWAKRFANRLINTVKMLAVSQLLVATPFKDIVLIGTCSFEFSFYLHIWKVNRTFTAQFRLCVHCTERNLVWRMIKHLSSQTLTGFQPASGICACLGTVDKTCKSVNLSPRDALG